MTGIVRKRESAHGGGTQEDRSTVNFGLVLVQTLAACVPGKCFIFCAMPLGQHSKSSYNVKKTSRMVLVIPWCGYRPWCPKVPWNPELWVVLPAASWHCSSDRSTSSGSPWPSIGTDMRYNNKNQYRIKHLYGALIGLTPLSFHAQKDQTQWS